MSLHAGASFLGGLAIVILGAELLLRGASRIAAMLRLSPILIGLTIVAIGTSAPELGVGITAVAEGKGELAVATIAGSNIVNILFILGLSAALRPLPLHLLIIQLDVPVMIGSALVLLVMAMDGVIARVEGVLLVVGGICYTTARVCLSRREPAEIRQEFSNEYSVQVLGAGRGVARGAWNGLLLLVGIALTVLGADLLVSGAVAIAQDLGVSDAVIGLTIVAIGTSAPELVTTVVATVKNDRDVAIGNLIGSSIINILVILGLTCAVASDGVDVSRDVLWIDLPLAAAVAIACLPVFRSDHVVSRREGVGFVVAYLAYLATHIFLRGLAPPWLRT